MKLLLAVVLLSVPLHTLAQWTYRTTKDDMRGLSTKLAQVDSTNRVQLGFPYHGGSKLRLVLRKRSDSELDVLAFIDRGQLPCHDDCKLVTKFDQDEIRDWAATGPESGRSEIIFLDEAEDFITRLRSSKKLIVEVLLYDHGRAQFTFNTRGLKWE